MVFRLDFPSGFVVIVSIMRFLKHRNESYSGFRVTRRNCLRYLIHGGCLWLTMPLFPAPLASKTTGRSILHKYLGEALGYQIGFWLISHCGNARTRFSATDVPDIYRIRLEGHGIGFINSLLGGVTYSYTSFCRYVSDQDRLQPVYFELKKKRGNRMSLRSVRFNHGESEIVFIRTESSGETGVDRVPMKANQIYEDYLTLFYNFRHGYYGPLQRNRQYRLPLVTKKQLQPVKLHIADVEAEKRYRRRESTQTDKDFFIRFQINPKDVSSGSGEITGWLSADGTPVKGTIQDVIFFGDLWGDLIEKQFTTPVQQVTVPATINDML
jgi:hypothetical protein